MSNEARIKLLKAQRASAKRSLTTYETFLKKLDLTKEFSVLEKRYADMDINREQFEKVQTELESLIEEPESEQYRTDFEETYFSTYAIATDLLSTRAQSNIHPPSNQFLHNINPSQDSTETFNRQNNISNLPKINLPTFSGSYDTWLGFHDLFKSLVHEDTRIPVIHKLYYLKGCLTGEAEDVIDSIEPSAENYLVAWKLLKERYDNRKFIRHNHAKALITLPCINRDFPVRALLDQLQKHLRALQALDESVNSWETLLIVIIRDKLNSFLLDKWEEYTADSEKPTMKEMITFLQRRAQFEDTQSHQNVTKSASSSDKRVISHSHSKQRSPQVYSAATHKIHCSYCEEDHPIWSCKKFAGLSPKERYQAARKAVLCVNCLRKNHRVNACSSKHCQKCNQKHHTLLHLNKNNVTNSIDEASSTQTASQSSVNLHAHISSEALLATAVVDLINKQGKTKSCRVFLDAGSQAHFISERTAAFLNLDKKSVNISVTGVDGISTEIQHSVTATIKSRFSKYQKTIDLLVISQITKTMPSIQINHANLEIPKNIFLADPDFYRPSEIDLLIGVKLFYKLLCIGQIALKGHPDAVLQKTQFGWIVAGEIINAFSSVNEIQCNLTIHANPLDINLTRFWEIEELPYPKVLSPEERACESHFKIYTTRNESGRYIVRLSFNEKKNQLGDSRSMAQRRFNYIENRLAKDAVLKTAFVNFLEEYRELGHMSLYQQEHTTKLGFYLPHHSVVKEDSVTTRVRVVFDGSAKSSSGVSLNQTLMVGPKIQDDLFQLLTRFRSHAFALSADIEKMYRQVKVHPDDAVYQKILFRTTAEQPIKEYTLDTITYGTSCASFLAIRSLHQLAEDEGANHPVAASILKRDFYVDDLLTGANSYHEAAVLRDDLLQLLQKGGFLLRKWVLNDATLIPHHQENENRTHMSLDLDNTIKTLGIQWNSREDCICYSVKLEDYPHPVTKRSILSQVAKLFDPLGLLGPVIVRAKLIIQHLWKSGVSWDESIPADLHTSWIEYKGQLPSLEKGRFDRLIIFPNFVDLQMHGFCDASERAYGACIYLRSIDPVGSIRIRLVCSKSRVAPLKPLTLPRLELCAAVLLARLYTHVKQSLSLNFHSCHLWSDSTIALHWISTPPHLLKTFVSNRVAEIQNLTQGCSWRHVASHDNPADLVSRGMTPLEFAQATIWRNGPSWLDLNETLWPHEKTTVSNVPEMRSVIPSQFCMKIELENQNLLERYSSIAKLRRVIAYIYRLFHNLKNKTNRIVGPLGITEIADSDKIIIKLVQTSAFSKEINSLILGKTINPKSNLISLNPFLDAHGVLRVGGRITSSELPYTQKHPILLPPKHFITQQIIREEHLRLKHAGAQTTLYSIRENYWPLDGRNITRKIIHQCIPCFRAKPRGISYIMGNLLQVRVSYSRPFFNVGIDYCGPFFIKEKRLRNRNKLKVYVSIYVCMSTKAVHLELVSDLTSEAFIASLKRFFSRRGKSNSIWSDNATNFVGAYRKLNELHKLLISKEHNQRVQEYLETQKIVWHFIPPKSPHFGGLWEAAVKSFKHHLLRTIGNTLLTFEQLETYLIEIEAILNSRPISPLSSDPNDIQPLTPGHFLIGGPLTSFPQTDFRQTHSNHLSTWHHAQQMKQHFWTRWHNLHQLIVRNKDCTNSNAFLKIGHLVLIKEDNLPPLQWALGRITAVHPGEDGVIRVVTLKTAHSEIKRCVKKLCPLPSD